MISTGIHEAKTLRCTAFGEKDPSKANKGQGGGGATFCLCYYELVGRERLSQPYYVWEREICCNGQPSTQTELTFGRITAKRLPIIISVPPPFVVTRGGLNLGGCNCPPSP